MGQPDIAQSEEMDKLITTGASAVEPLSLPLPPPLARWYNIVITSLGTLIGNTHTPTGTYAHVYTQWGVYRTKAKGSSLEPLCLV